MSSISKYIHHGHSDHQQHILAIKHLVNYQPKLINMWSMEKYAIVIKVRKKVFYQLLFYENTILVNIKYVDVILSSVNQIYVKSILMF